jgi:hypothetical protein
MGALRPIRSPGRVHLNITTPEGEFKRWAQLGPADDQAAGGPDSIGQDPAQRERLREPLVRRELDEPDRELDERERDRLEPLLRPREPEVLRRRALDDLRELDDVRELGRRELERRDPLRRSEAGTSAWTTLLVSVGMSPSRYLAMRSSSRRMLRASFAVSLSLTLSANVSIAV